MSYLYERADIYDLIESDSREQIIRKDWAAFLGDREIHSMLDVSIGTGTMTLPLQELGITIFGSDLSESMLSRCQIKAENKHIPIELKCCDSEIFPAGVITNSIVLSVQEIHLLMFPMKKYFKLSSRWIGMSSLGDTCASILGTGKRFNERSSVFMCSIHSTKTTFV